MRKTHIIVHHSATEDGDTFSWSSIRRFHVNERGWRDIGYHLGTELVNGHYENIMGRAWDDVGAHCPDGGMNATGLGWCIVGNFDIIPPNSILIDHIVKTAVDLCRVLKIQPANILGHVEAQQKWGAVRKTCPGKKFDLNMLRQRVSDQINKIR